MLGISLLNSHEQTECYCDQKCSEWAVNMLNKILCCSCGKWNEEWKIETGFDHAWMLIVLFHREEWQPFETILNIVMKWVFTSNRC